MYMYMAMAMAGNYVILFPHEESTKDVTASVAAPRIMIILS